MKIQVEEGQDKPFLPDGRHVVEITHIDEGSSEYKGVPFIACRMENEDGFVTQRFYLSEQARPILMGFVKAAGIDVAPGDTFDTKQLLGKRVSADVGDYTYNEPDNGAERTIRQASNFEPVG